MFLVWPQCLMQLKDVITNSSSGVGGFYSLCNIGMKLFDSGSLFQLGNIVDDLKKDNDVCSMVLEIFWKVLSMNAAERYSTTYNVGIVGIKDSADENCKQLIIDPANEVYVDLSMSLEVAHRVGKKGNNKPCHILVKFYSLEDHLRLLCKCDELHD
ncbi:unnamed protein product [Didymodactylos carnosus]|uniref:Uncharacterized protein n=1 Tax=Didymodactylos carnosus TaxID=1234261 RepID=A0A8S2CZV6_9BILA|nr:unnamed protein product [Didymodactylos carnosus]CAF3589266.1 unnamed protein product [Didymodactylos carnosus]